MKQLARVRFYYKLITLVDLRKESLGNEEIDIKILRSRRGLISLSLRCAAKLVVTVEVLQYVKVTCARLHLSSSFDEIGLEYGLQPEILKGEIIPSEIKRYIYI